jgi:hypothetical protein
MRHNLIGVIDWSSKEQPCIVMSSIEVDYMTTFEATKQVM